MGTIIRMPVDHHRHVTITDDARRPLQKTTPTCEGPSFSVRRKISADGALLLVRVTGEIDLRTAPVLAEVLELACRDATSRPDITRIVADLRLVTFLAAAGLRVLDRASHNCASYGIGFRVAADHLAVTRPLTITRLDLSLQLAAHAD